MINTYKRTLRTIIVPLLERCLRFLDGRSWVPVFYFRVPHTNTDTMLVLHVLHNIQVKTSRRIVIIGARPSWPWLSAKDRFFNTFIRRLNPKITYIFVPKTIQHIIQALIIKVMRLFQITEVLSGPMGLNSTFRIFPSSTEFHTDILNYGSRVVFQIPESHERVLEDNLKSLGVSADDWFVCAHAREHGFWTDVIGANRDTYRPEVSDHRNVDIRTYYPAFDYITSKGGKVIRMGDRSMTPIKDMDGVVDYPFTEHWSMVMDLYLLSRCQFLLGCSSGISAFGLTFGVPTLITNHTEPSESAFQGYDNFLFMFKHMIEESSHRPLGLEEIFRPRTYAGDNAQKLEELGYRWESNDSTDILEATKEMLELVESDSFDGPMTKEQEQFHQLRLNQLESLSMSDEFSGMHRDRISVTSSAKSRISASFAGRYFKSVDMLDRTSSNQSSLPV